MGQKLSEDQLKIYKRIDEVLFYIWDPIGVRDSAYCRDEYQSYLPQVFKMILYESPDEDIVSYLTELESKHMGMGRLFGTKKRIQSVVSLLKEIRNKCLQ